MKKEQQFLNTEEREKNQSNQSLNWNAAISLGRHAVYIINMMMLCVCFWIFFILYSLLFTLIFYLKFIQVSSCVTQLNGAQFSSSQFDVKIKSNSMTYIIFNSHTYNTTHKYILCIIMINMRPYKRIQFFSTLCFLTLLGVVGRIIVDHVLIEWTNEKSCCFMNTEQKFCYESIFFLSHSSFYSSSF